MGEQIASKEYEGEPNILLFYDSVKSPFFTTQRGQGGTGLGLHIVFNLVTQKLGGTIRCESEVGHGTRFMIEMPIS